jgi:hypothetical protein
MTVTTYSFAKLNLASREGQQNHVFVPSLFYKADGENYHSG